MQRALGRTVPLAEVGAVVAREFGVVFSPVTV
jgi:hypothetical protein